MSERRFDSMVLCGDEDQATHRERRRHALAHRVEAVRTIGRNGEKIDGVDAIPVRDTKSERRNGRRAAAHLAKTPSGPLGDPVACRLT